MKRALLIVLATVAVLAAPAGLVRSAGEPARAAGDPDATLRQALANLADSRRVTTALSSEGSFKVGEHLIINADKRYVYEKLSERGRTTKLSVETSRLAFTRNSKRHCWMKRKKRFNTSLRFKEMKRRISDAQQIAADVIAYTHDEEMGVFRIEMRYDPAALLPLEFNASYIDDGQGEPGVKSYRRTVEYSAGDRVPKHRPVCRGG